LASEYETGKLATSLPNITAKKFRGFRHLVNTLPRTFLRLREVAWPLGTYRAILPFFISRLYHYIAAQTSLPSERFRGTSLFFLLQPNIVLCEDFTILFGCEKLGLRSSRWKYLGYIWTFTQLSITATGFIDECVRHRLVSSSTVFPFSLAEKLMTKYK
jgi:hypothetical protein